MARYIYDELKEEFKAEGKELNPSFIIHCMAKVVHEMGYTAPGEVPEELYEVYKQKTKDYINERFEYYNHLAIMGLLAINRALKKRKEKKAKNNRS